MRWIIGLVAMVCMQVLFAQKNHVALISTDKKAHKKLKKHKHPSVSPSLPFELIEGLIIVEAKINGQSGKFVLDTGAPMIVLNKPVQQSSTGFVATGISQSINIQNEQIESFQWGQINRHHLEGISLDISNLEKATNQPLLGMIGYDILKEYELVIDYERQLIRLIHPLNKKAIQYLQPKYSFHFSFQSHLPVFKIKVGRQKVTMGLDTGSEANIIDHTLLKEFARHGQILKERKTILTGIDQISSISKIVDIKETSIGDFEFGTMEYLATDLGYIQENGLKINGLLGYPFLKSCVLSINFQKGIIHIWKKS